MDRESVTRISDKPNGSRALIHRVARASGLPFPASRPKGTSRVDAPPDVPGQPARPKFLEADATALPASRFHAAPRTVPGARVATLARNCRPEACATQGRLNSDCPPFLIRGPHFQPLTVFQP